MKNALMNFIADNQTYVISYDVDKYLEDMGFDFRLNQIRCTGEYFKTIYYNDRVVKIVVDSNKNIYVSEFVGMFVFNESRSRNFNESRSRNVMVGDLEGKEITVEFLDSEEFISALKSKMQEVTGLS